MYFTWRSINLPEFFEDHALVLGPDADARVRHAESYRRSVVVTVNFDLTTLGCEFDRVAQQVIQNLLEANPIGANSALSFNPLLHLNALGHGERPYC